ncbi:glycosyltransferase family 2 protein [Robertkochia solimangrovi]|uniref:glycosyltransferase family 2 protein n=1 Tax=Robertkochia solimangrovi TaxID=2213046 RepID=UPI00117D94D8|nr:glycosyltransferase family 2 protein [Robertkochia solimangrovi]TRZ44266.1 glycosyltransferase family 2 protein [Robertkochia solimangrovi]
MKYSIVIPAHNEEKFIKGTLISVSEQTLQPSEVIIVNDHSTDSTEKIIDDFCSEHLRFKKFNTTSSDEHMPGSKVVNAFKQGYDQLQNPYDVIVKLDADLILPNDYFESVIELFKKNPKAGVVGGFAYEEENGEWKLNHPMNKDHVRGAFKAYSKACFQAMGGLKSSMGWDTVDELLARYHGYKIITLEDLKVKHLRPTGKSYNAKARTLQGEAMFKMRYGFLITCIASAKMASKQGNPQIFKDNLKGFMNAWRSGIHPIVNKKEGAFIRKHRIKGILQKLV